MPIINSSDRHKHTHTHTYQVNHCTLEEGSWYTIYSFTLSFSNSFCCQASDGANSYAVI